MARSEDVMGNQKDGQQLADGDKEKVGGASQMIGHTKMNGGWAPFALVRWATRRFLKGTMRLSKTVQTYVQPTTHLLHPYTTSLSRRHKP
jgi:hypothetical protein